MRDTATCLDPETVSRISRLDLVARLVVEGFITGLHRSPYHGFSVEFSEHRPYMPGDPLRDLDWKAYAKSDRLYVKRCLAVAGQVVEIRDKVVYVDGERQVDPPFSKYVDSRIFPAVRTARDNLAPRSVPTGSIFVVGDNRDNSRDSRHWGFLPLDLVVGRALFVYWSAAPLPTSAASVWQRIWDLGARIRWQRVGVWVE